MLLEMKTQIGTLILTGLGHGREVRKREFKLFTSVKREWGSVATLPSPFAPITGGSEPGMSECGLGCILSPECLHQVWGGDLQ